MDIERLKDLKWYVDDEVFTQDVRADILALLDEAIVRQSVTSAAVAISQTETTSEEVEE